MTVEELRKIDVDFNQSLFISKVNNMIENLYEAITKNELEKVSYYLGENIYQKYRDMMQKLSEKNERVVYDQVSVYSEIKDILEENGKISIVVSSICQYIKYYENKETKEFLRGNKEETTEAIHRYKMIKNEMKSENTNRCPNCGVTYDFIKEEQCPHCGSVKPISKYDYIMERVSE